MLKWPLPMLEVKNQFNNDVLVNPLMVTKMIRQEKGVIIKHVNYDRVEETFAVEPDYDTLKTMFNLMG